MKDKMLNKWHAVCIILASAWVASQGVRLTPCGGAGYQEVEENTNLTFTCDQYSAVAIWKFKPLGSSSQPGTLDLSPTASDTGRLLTVGRCDVAITHACHQWNLLL
ncbi:hypothetical protein ACOMHN_059283 [Nucella lapillus]